jgi:hypothetical protein
MEKKAGKWRQMAGKWRKRRENRENGGKIQFFKESRTWRVSSHSKDGGLEVLLVSGEVDEGYHLRRLLANPNPVLTLML